MPLTDTLKADARALHQVMMQASLLARRGLMDTLSAFELTVPQYYALLVACRAEGGCTMSALAEATHQVSATMTGIIDRLAERGLVERREDPADRRARRVYITADGAGLMAEIAGQQDAQNLHILARFSPAERQHLIALMGKYLLALETITAATPAAQ
ncbi:MAG: MarR family transcriptional regulator [Anaerolineae bacterium]|nr:MarR family transcriptional regulator [Anaerolineae bacterium]